MGYDSAALKEAFAARRSVYAINKKAPVDDKRINEIVEAAITHTPSSFNTQTTRLVVLLKAEHDKFWDIVSDTLKAFVPAEKWEHTNARIQGFRNGYGTILFYEDMTPFTQLPDMFQAYADKFPQWSEHTSAMHQYALWTALETEGFGANLQHYNPLPNKQASATWNVPAEWDLKAQLVFGGREEGWEGKLLPKTSNPIEKRVFVHGA